MVSRTLTSVGPNATLIAPKSTDEIAARVQGLKAQLQGEIEIAGPTLAQTVTELGLIDAYRLYLHPVVLGHGKKYFAGPRPRLRLQASERMDGDVICLTYVPAEARETP